MEKNVKAVIALMETLEVSLEDVAAALGMRVCKPEAAAQTSAAPPHSASSGKSSNSLPDNRLGYQSLSNGMTAVIYGGHTIGLLIRSSSAGTFVLAHRNYARNLDFSQTRNRLRDEEPIVGRSWIVPEDKHFKAIQTLGVQGVNKALREINGDEIGRSAYLSATSQHNRPASWLVRLILPLS